MFINSPAKLTKAFMGNCRDVSLSSMGDCEICGAMKVKTSAVFMGKAEVRSCTRCSEKLGMQKKGVAPGIAKASHMKPRPKKTSQLMLKGEKELVHDFAQRVIKARESKGWDKKMLAKKCAERVNVIQAVESGKTPTDSVVRKLERMLEIDLMEVPSHDGEQFVNSGSSSGMTLGDFLAKARKDLND